MKYKDRKQLEIHKNNILVCLPAFVNRILLLLNSGVVLQEAMTIIALDCQKAKENELNILEKKYLDIYTESQKTGKNLLGVFSHYCKKSQIKEMSRLSAMLIDADNRGINVCDKLNEENILLWEQRKRIFLEKIRLLDSKMSFPLALLLIALIIISAAPALMQMNI